MEEVLTQGLLHPHEAEGGDRQHCQSRKTAYCNLDLIDFWYPLGCSPADVSPAQGVLVDIEEWE